MTVTRYCLLLGLLAGAATAWAAPYLGYVYPAGGQQGTTVRVTIGGMRMGNVRDVSISGAGAQGVFVSFEGAGGPLNQLERDLLRDKLKAIEEQRHPTPAPKTPPATATPPAAAPAVAPPAAAPAVAPPATPAATPPAAAAATAPATATTTAATAATTPAATTATATPAATTVFPPKPEVKLPDIPELRDLDQKTDKELRRIFQKFVSRQKRTKPPIAENVVLDITIDPTAAPGDRELRLLTPGGVSNPLVFQVGTLPELRERDKEDEESVDPPAAEAPVLYNGQILAGEVDHYTLKLHAGQRLAISAQARHLIPYLADAVPGWCQAVVALSDANGKEIGFADYNRRDPDPLLLCTVPQDGDYTLAVRDALYRGREDFVYRVAVRPPTAEDTLYHFAPLTVLPPEGVPATWDPTLPWVDGPLTAVDEAEPNNTPAAAQKLTTPALVSGRIAQPGDVDDYAFTGKAGDTLVAEVYARRLGGPMDALLRVLDAGGKVLAVNDDHPSPEMGLITHNADAYVSVKLPADGTYTVQVSDAQRHGGDDYRYYLRVSPPQGDFALRATPSALNVTAGGTTNITIYAVRKDGWDGDIDVSIVDAPTGFMLKDARIPAGKDQATVKLSVPRKRLDGPLTLRLVGTATIDGRPVVRPAVAADHLMQAFAYYHLVPAQALLVWTPHK